MWPGGHWIQCSYKASTIRRCILRILWPTRVEIYPRHVVFGAFINEINSVLFLYIFVVLLFKSKSTGVAWFAPEKREQSRVSRGSCIKCIERFCSIPILFKTWKWSNLLSQTFQTSVLTLCSCAASIKMVPTPHIGSSTHEPGWGTGDNRTSVSSQMIWELTLVRTHSSVASSLLMGQYIKTHISQYKDMTRHIVG